jgi:hypothetical protein
LAGGSLFKIDIGFPSRLMTGAAQTCQYTVSSHERLAMPRVCAASKDFTAVFYVSETYLIDPRHA